MKEVRYSLFALICKVKNSLHHIKTKRLNHLNEGSASCDDVNILYYLQAMVSKIMLFYLEIRYYLLRT
jgi:hypothetical protein